MRDGIKSSAARLRQALFTLPVAAFVIILVALLGFAELADGIGPNDDLHHFDLRMAAALRIEGPSAAYTFFALITHLGSGVALTTIGLAVSAAFIAKRDVVSLAAWVLAIGGSGLLNFVLKQWFERARPGEVPLLSTWSFPSGHAMNSIVAYGMLTYLAARLLSGTRFGVLLGTAVVIVLSVGASRILLSYHYVSDVVGGYAAGLAWLTVCITWLELARRRVSGGAPAASGQ